MLRFRRLPETIRTLQMILEWAPHFLQDVGFVPCCSRCGARTVGRFYQCGENVEYLCDDCSVQMDQFFSQNRNRRSHLILGIPGAILGMAAGCAGVAMLAILWILLFGTGQILINKFVLFLLKDEFFGTLISDLITIGPTVLSLHGGLILSGWGLMKCAILGYRFTGRCFDQKAWYFCRFFCIVIFVMGLYLPFSAVLSDFSGPFPQIWENSMSTAIAAFQKGYWEFFLLFLFEAAFGIAGIILAGTQQLQKEERRTSFRRLP